MKEIKKTIEPCPFCSGAAMIFKSEANKQFYVTCVDETEKCNVISSTIGFLSDAEAVAAWNKRGSIILCH